MPESARVQVFTLDELSDESTPGRKLENGGYVMGSPSPKSRAMQWVLDGVRDFSSEQINETIEQELNERGLDGLVNSGSPVWALDTQGSGVAFSGHVDLEGIKPIEGDGAEIDIRGIAAIREAMIPFRPDQLKVTVTHDSHYTHSNSFDVETYHYCDHPDDCDADAASQVEEDVSAAVLAWLQDLSRYLYDIAQKEVEYLEGEEHLKETAEANEYRFNKYGEPVHHILEDVDA